jgi:exodeoxyribonuclease-5
VRFIVEVLDVAPEQIAYASFTGKAAEVLRKKGNPNAMTMHRLLFDSVPRPAGGFMHKPKPALGFTIVVVDEVSMVPKSLMDQLFKHKVYVICLGDPFQLPPIDTDEDNHLLDHPHVFLDEIVRQAMDSEIIQLTMKIRENATLDDWKGNDVMILPNHSLNTGMLLWGDQVIVGTNMQRLAQNNNIRALLGKGINPEDGDKVICLRNYWESINYDGDALVNGTIGTLTNSSQEWLSLPRQLIYNEPIQKFDVLNFDFVANGSIYPAVMGDRIMLLTGEKCCDWRLAYKLNRAKNRYGDLLPKEFSYGYAITCHKAQGSEWDKVLVLEEKFPFNKTEHARWLYTAATRAVDKLVIVKHD